MELKIQKIYALTNFKLCILRKLKFRWKRMKDAHILRILLKTIYNGYSNKIYCCLWKYVGVHILHKQDY